MIEILGEIYSVTNYTSFALFYRKHVYVILGILAF
jgi:hypothetical protein